jgi:hypothetical protein
MPTEVISDMDTPHRLSVTGIWELPFGKGKAIGGSVSGIADRFLSGWQVNGSYAVQSARPIGWGNYILNGDFKDINLSDSATPDRWFNTDAGFNKVSSQQLVKNVRTFPLRMSFVRTDVMNNMDFSVIKNTKIVEGKELQFRAEALNFFNHPNFGAPDSNPTSANFGKVTGTYNYSRRIQMSLKFIF